jgi:heterodisulfide reductase subunit C
VLIKRGENTVPREKIRKCMLCGKCILVCPRGVNTRNVVFLAREAFKKAEADAV